ncbi:MAG: winged helix-turn-helix domain-containing protein [Pseudomonadales bacterium]|nr:winged helix-turn-helix domain-containing protein [Pseudomonadales bacterium]
MDVLLCLIEVAPAVVSRNQLIDRVWRNALVGDGVIHQAISHLRRALHDHPKQPRCIETIPRRGYRLIAQVARREQWSDCTELSVSSALRPGPAGTSSPLLAVLPFDNLAGDPNLVYFSDGISEEILQTLVATTDLRIVGRASSFQFRANDKVPANVAAVLGCTHVLDGSVRKSGSRIRISAQLMECGAQTTLWNQTFEHELTDVFALQDEVAAAVASAMRVRFASAGKLGSIDPSAFDAYLQARSSTSQWLGANDPVLLERAIARVPTFARAWAALAVSRAIDSHVEIDPARARGCRVQAVEAADAALRLDPSSGAALVALSIVQPVCGHFAERDALIESALAVAPSDTTTLFWAGRWRWTVGRLQEFLVYLEQCHRVDPLWPQGVHQYATALWVTGRRVEAMQVWDEAVLRWPGLDYLYAAQLAFASASRDWGRVDLLLRLLRQYGPRNAETERAVRYAGDIRHWQPRDCRRLEARMEKELERRGSVPLRLLIFACDVGMNEEAYSMAERSDYRYLFEAGGRLSVGDFGLHHLFSPVARCLREDPRFPGLCRRLGLCEYWVESGNWPDCTNELKGLYGFESAISGQHSPGRIE